MRRIADVLKADRTMAVGLKAVFLICKYGIPHLIDRGGDSIINISSPNGVVSNPGFSVYSAVKGGVNALTKNLPSTLGRVGTPADIGNMAGFLASDEASFVNGAVIRVDGLLTAQSPEALVVPSFRRV